MGGGESKGRALFESLDSDHTGSLKLDRLLSVERLPGINHPVTHSPMLLFRFDYDKDGGLKSEGFEKLIQFVTNLQREELKSKSMYEEEEVHHVDLAQVDDDPETPVPMITRPRPDPNLAQAGADAERESQREAPQKKKFTEEEKSKALVDALTRRAKVFMSEILQNPETRKTFHSWLFKLADFNNQEKVTPEGLKLLLQALAYDGISSDHLMVSTTETSSDSPENPAAGSTDGNSEGFSAITQGVTAKAPQPVANPFTPVSQEMLKSMDADSKRILEEYDTGKTGFLVQEEFMALADVITTNYQLLFEDSSEYVGKYHLTKKIGEGAYASVWIGLDKDGNRKAVKMVNKGDAAAMSRLDVEIKAMIVVRHPNVVSLEEVLETDSHVYFVMELLTGGNLGDHVVVKPFHNDVARAFFEQILLGVEFCHSKGIYHRDLKLENIMLDSDGLTVKVGDFGHAAISPGWDMHSTGLVGSLFHVSPEQINGECYSGEKIDIWALGILLYRMLTGRPPFFTENVHEMMDRICNARFDVPDTMSPLAADLIRGILQPNPDDRLSLEEIFDHPWMCAEPILATIPSLLTDVYVADCITVSKDVIIMSLHNIFREHNIRSIQRGNKFEEIQCYSLDRELRFIVRIKTIRHEAAKQIRTTLSSTTLDDAATSQAMASSIEAAEKRREQMAQQPPFAGYSLPVEVAAEGTSSVSPVQMNIPGLDSSVIATAPSYSSIVENSRAQEIYQQQQPSEDTPAGSLEDEGELLYFEFSLVSGFGVDFRTVVQSIKSKLDKQLRAMAVVKTTPPSFLDTKSLLQSAATLAEQFREAFAESLEEEKATVLLLGKTGSGKSSVSNKIFGTKMAQVGQGKPVTTHFVRYQLAGKPVVIYDSRGYEVNTAADFAKEIKEFFEDHNDVKGGNDHIHVVWYVVDGTSSRFEPFEAQFCKTVLADIPTIVLVNKADLCQAADIESLQKTIETLGLPKCKAVVPTVAVDALGPPPEKCTQCGSDDVSELRKKRQWRCNECEYVGDLQTSHTVDDGMKRIVKLTQDLVPARVREAFVSGQMISIQDKINMTKSIVTECYNAFFDPNEVALRRVLKLLARICGVWDITSSGGSAVKNLMSNGEADNAVILPVAQQVFSMAIPLLKRGADDAISDDYMDGDSGTDGFDWGWGFLEHILGVFDGNLSPGDDKEKKIRAPVSKNLYIETPKTPPPAPLPPTSVSAARGSTPTSPLGGGIESPEMAPYDVQIRTAAAQLRSGVRSNTTSSDSSSRSGSSTPTSATETKVPTACEVVASAVSEGRLNGIMTAHTHSSSASNSPAVQKRSDSADPPMSPDRRRSGSCTNGESTPVRAVPSHSSSSGLSSPGASSVVSQTGAPSKECLVHTAVAIAWAEALMRLHILIVENGIQVPSDVLMRRRMDTGAYSEMLRVVQLCFDRAFVSFNTDRISLLKESLASNPLNKILDSVLSAPQLMQKEVISPNGSTAIATVPASNGVIPSVPGVSGQPNVAPVPSAVPPATVVPSTTVVPLPATAKDASSTTGVAPASAVAGTNPVLGASQAPAASVEVKKPVDPTPTASAVPTAVTTVPGPAPLPSPIVIPEAPAKKSVDAPSIPPLPSVASSGITAVPGPAPLPSPLIVPEAQAKKPVEPSTETLSKTPSSVVPPTNVKTVAMPTSPLATSSLVIQSIPDEALNNEAALPPPLPPPLQ